jgi:hypothetical protein
MDKILETIKQKMDMGYSSIQLEVDFGMLNCESEEQEKEEGYYLSKLNGWGTTPITDLLAVDGEVNDKELIAILDSMDIAHCF